MQIGKLSQSLEDYLEAIFRLLQKGKIARVRDIARMQEVKTSSVISALRRLASEGLVDYKAREYVDLTPKGRELGFRLFQRHTFLKRFLTDVLQVDNETAEKDACQLEHAISVDTIERIAAMSEFLTYCPHVDNELINNFRTRWLQHLNSGNEDCRGDKGGILSGDMLRINELERGDGGYITRIVAEDEIRRSLIRRGVMPGASIRIEDVLEDGARLVRISGEEVRFDATEAEHIFVWPRSTCQSTPEDQYEYHRTLADLTPGTDFCVVRITANGEIRQRMNDMGFIRGAEGRILREALLRDPIEIELNGSLLSLRRVEATHILVEEVDA